MRGCVSETTLKRIGSAFPGGVQLDRGDSLFPVFDFV